MKFNPWMKVGLVMAVAALFIICVASANAQVQTQQNTTVGKGTKDVTVEKGEVVLVDGNDLILKMEDGTIRHFPNIPETARVNVDGQQLGIHDLKPGNQHTTDGKDRSDRDRQGVACHAAELGHFNS